MKNKIIAAVALFSLAAPAMAITIDGTTPDPIDYNAINAQLNSAIQQNHDQIAQAQQQMQNQQQINAIINGAIHSAQAAQQQGIKKDESPVIVIGPSDIPPLPVIVIDPSNDPLSQFEHQIQQEQQQQQIQNQINAQINGAIQNAIHAGSIHRSADTDRLPSLLASQQSITVKAASQAELDAMLAQMQQEQQWQQQQNQINAIIAGAVANAQNLIHRGPVTKQMTDEQYQEWLKEIQQQQQQQAIDNQINAIIAGAVANAQNIHRDASQSQLDQWLAEFNHQQQQQQQDNQINAIINGAVANAQHIMNGKKATLSVGLDGLQKQMESQKKINGFTNAAL